MCAEELALVKFSELKALERKTIQTIRTEGAFGRLSSLVTTAHKAQVEPRSTSNLDIHLSFTLPTRLREDKGPHAIDRAFHVGCIAVPAGADEISHLSYSVLIGEGPDPSKAIARKFHFDFEPVAMRNRAESKPTYHLQICGELSGHHRNAGYTDADINHLLPSWSQPRVPAQPTSLALVLNWLFIEFGCEAPVKDVRTSPRWRSVVREAERSVLKPYYVACANFLALSANDDESFISKSIYEET